jgi:hypothetical protein
MDNTKKIRWGLIIVTFFFVGLAVDYFFLHLLFQEKLKEQQRLEEVMPTAEKPSAQKLEAHPSAPTAVRLQEAPTSAGSPAEFQEKATVCMGPELGQSATPDDLIRNLEKTNPVVKSQFQLENTHIQLPDGSERRLHMIIADNTNHKNARELRYYKLDAEGLPERIELSSEQTYNPKPEYIQSLLSQGKIIYHETKDTKTLKDGTSMVLTKVNEKVYEFQIFTHGKTLSCREMSCLCR